MKAKMHGKLNMLWHIIRTSEIIDILFVGGLILDEGIWRIERIVGRNPIYLKFEKLFIEMYSIENERGCALNWNVCDQIKLPLPVYEDDPDEIEFRYVLYSIFDMIALGLLTNQTKCRIERGLAILDKFDNNIVRGIDLAFSSGIIFRFDPFSFDGLQLNIFAGKLGDKLDIDRQNFLIEEVELCTEM